MSAANPFHPLDHRLASLEPREVKWLCLLIEHLHDLRFGSLHLVVHEGCIVQVERTEKHRYDMNAAISLLKEDKGGSPDASNQHNPSKATKTRK